MQSDIKDQGTDERLVGSILRRRYEQRVGRRNQLQEQLDKSEENLRSLRRQLKITEQAQNIVKVVALQTQEQLEYHISQVVTAANEVVFGDRAYSLAIEFIERRGKTECDLWFCRDEQQIDPVGSAGLGMVDIAAFALRAACWSLMPSAAPVLLLDESFRHLKQSEPNRRAMAMTCEVARQLGLQVIMISDERCPREDIASSVDRLFEVAISDGHSYVA